MSNTSGIDVPFFLFDYILFIPDFFINFFVMSVFYGTHCILVFSITSNFYIEEAKFFSIIKISL